MHKYLLPALCAALFSINLSAAQERPMDKETFTSAAQANLAPDLKPMAFLEGTWDVEQRILIPFMNGNNQGMNPAQSVQMQHAQDHIAKPDGGLRAPQDRPDQKSEGGLQLRGTFRVKRDLAGRAFFGRFESEGLQGEGFFGDMILTSEKRRVAAQQQPEPTVFTAYWADSKGITSFTRDVKWENDTLTIQSADMFGDVEGEARMSYHKLDENRVEFQMDLKLNGQWQKFSTGMYTRAEKAR